MERYIALLRGINVGGHKKIKMLALKQLFVNMGCRDVITYIQSGNVVFSRDDMPVTSLESSIHDAILSHFGFDVSVWIVSSDYMQSIYVANPFLDAINNGELETKNMYFTFLSQQVDITVVTQRLYTSVANDKEAYELDGENKVIYLYAENGYGRTKFTNAFFEKKLNCRATTRNMKTVCKILELSAL